MGPTEGIFDILWRPKELKEFCEVLAVQHGLQSEGLKLKRKQVYNETPILIEGFKIPKKDKPWNKHYCLVIVGEKMKSKKKKNSSGAAIGKQSDTKNRLSNRYSSRLNRLLDISSFVDNTDEQQTEFENYINNDNNIPNEKDRKLIRSWFAVDGNRRAVGASMVCLLCVLQ